MVAARHGSAKCMKLLLARGVELGAAGTCGNTALHFAACQNYSESVQLLLQAGANPTIRDKQGKSPLNFAKSSLDCIPLLEATEAEPDRPGLLLNARALLDVRVAILKAHKNARAKGLSFAAEQRAALAVTPAHLERRVERGRELPRVTVEGGNEELVACLKYALGLEGGGGVHEGGGLPPHGMLKEVFVELCEMMVPKWARAKCEA